MKYHSSITHCSKVISKIKVLKKNRSNSTQGQGHMVKNVDLVTMNTQVKIQYQSFIFTLQKLLAMLMFQTDRMMD